MMIHITPLCLEWETQTLARVLEVEATWKRRNLILRAREFQFFSGNCGRLSKQEYKLFCTDVEDVCIETLSFDK